jgi:hypothetical protein
MRSREAALARQLGRPQAPIGIAKSPGLAGVMDPGRSDAGRVLARTCLTAAAIPTAGSLLLTREIGADKPNLPAKVPDFLGKVGPGCAMARKLRPRRRRRTRAQSGLLSEQIDRHRCAGKIWSYAIAPFARQTSRVSRRKARSNRASPSVRPVGQWNGIGSSG